MLYTDWVRMEPGVPRRRCSMRAWSAGNDRARREAFMRRGTMLVLGLLLACTAMPPSAADARPLLSKIFRGVTAPFGAILGGGRQAGRRAVHHRRAVASRSRTVARIAAPAAAGATAAAAAASTANASPATADAQAAATATTGSAAIPDATIQDARAVPLPAP